MSAATEGGRASMTTVESAKTDVPVDGAESRVRWTGWR